jgi:predicted PolB exonuclease-like 3'-5' exonuclease
LKQSLPVCTRQRSGRKGHLSSTQVGRAQAERKPDGIDGSRVEETVQAGQIEEVARYCESDVLNTYRVWLVYELFRGSITTSWIGAKRKSATLL